MPRQERNPFRANEFRGAIKAALARGDSYAKLEARTSDVGHRVPVSTLRHYILSNGVPNLCAFVSVCAALGVKVEEFIAFPEVLACSDTDADAKAEPEKEAKKHWRSRPTKPVVGQHAEMSLQIANVWKARCKRVNYVSAADAQTTFCGAIENQGAEGNLEAGTILDFLQGPGCRSDMTPREVIRHLRSLEWKKAPDKSSGGGDNLPRFVVDGKEL